MPPPVTANELLAELCTAQLLSPADAAQFRAPPDTTAAELVDVLVRQGFLTPLQADQAGRGFVQDLVLGPYRIMEEIGQGGMGGVFKALDIRLKRIVALKMIKPELV
ncbi:MAG TPA: hypothetical protein VH120_10050, partial [Gemmataceae bacterium]|nr:hypothetical protein [Gemmataceae bacterium]